MIETIHNEKIKIIAGTTLPLDFYVNSNDRPFPISDITIEFKMTLYGDTTAVLIKNTSDFEIENNKVSLVLSSNDTKDLCGIYEYVITFIDAVKGTDKRKNQIEVISDIK